MDSISELKLKSLIQLQNFPPTTHPYSILLMMETIYMVMSLDLESQPKPESEFMSLVAQAISVFKSMDLDSQPEQLLELMSLIDQKVSEGTDFEPKQALILVSLIQSTWSLEPRPEFISIIDQILLVGSDELKPKLDTFTDYSKWFSLIHETQPVGDPESKLLSLISQLTCVVNTSMGWKSKFMSLVIQIISLVSSMDLNSQPKPESELISLVTQAVSVFNSTDLDSLPEPLSKLISLISQRSLRLDSEDSNTKQEQESEFFSLFVEIQSLKPEPELISIIHQIYSLVISLNSATGEHHFLCPLVDVRLEGGKFHVTGEDEKSENKTWDCHPRHWTEFRLKQGEDATDHFLCQTCRGENHKFNKVPIEIRHPLHPKHPLQLVFLKEGTTRECYCCDEDLQGIFYYCSACDFAMNIVCVDKPPLLLAIDHPKWHEHTLALFTRHTPLACNLCSRADLSSPIYMCPPCGFVVHLRCINLPRVLQISRHPHRIYFTPSFDKEDWTCAICRKKIDTHYGGYSCIKDGCLCVAHSRCATQSNVWDGIELEGVPEENEEENIEPYLRISDGIIQHISHRQHYLKLDKNTGRDYDEDKQCHGCITPIYLGNFYSCMT